MAAPLAALLPNARQQFVDSNGAPLAAGTVTFYVPNSMTLATTWADPEETTVNPNPLTLDAGGWATIYGNGQYTEVVRDVYGNLVIEGLTQDSVSIIQQTASGLYGVDGGAVNALAVTLSPSTVTLPELTGIAIRVLVGNTNTGAVTLKVNGLVATGVLAPDGQQLIAGQLQQGGIAEFVFDGTSFQLQSINGATGTTATALQQQAPCYGPDAGAVNALVVTLFPVPASLAALVGAPIRVLVANTNTMASTLNVNGLGAIAIVGTDGTALASGELVTGLISEFMYNGTAFEMLSPRATTETVATLAAQGFAPQAANFAVVTQQSGSRAVGTTYTNATTKPIAVAACFDTITINTTVVLTIDGVAVATFSNGTSVEAGTVSGIVPVGGTYIVTSTASITIVSWPETT